MICDAPRQHCHPLAAASNTAANDPRWSPAADRIIFVRSPDLGPDGGFGATAPWIVHRQLAIADLSRGTTTNLTAFGHSIFWPQWSNDGREILLYRDGAVYLGAPGATTHCVVSGLARPSEFPEHFMFGHGVATPDDSPVAWTGE